MRLTEKVNNYYKSAKFQEDWANLGEANQKLGQLEDIEDELGIDLMTLFIFLLEGGYVKLHHSGGNFDTIDFENHFMLDPELKCLVHKLYQIKFLISDYGKTWALTREELE